MSKRKEKKLICKLTPKEDKIWEKGFIYYLDEGKSDSVADKKIFDDMKKDLTRLKKCTGFK